MKLVITIEAEGLSWKQLFEGLNNLPPPKSRVDPHPILDKKIEFKP